MTLPVTIHFLRQHGVKIISFDSKNILLWSEYSLNGVGGSEPKKIRNNMLAVRKFLGY